MPKFFYSLSARIYALVGLAIANAAALTFVLLSLAVDNAYEMREKELDNLTDAMVSVLTDLDAQVQAGSLTLEEAQERGVAAVETLRFGSAGYFVAMTRQNYMIAHPLAKELIGKDQTMHKDVHGVLVFQEFQKIVDAKGHGALVFHYHKPGSDIPEAKMGYAKLFKPWGWVVATGAYVSDIEADVAAMRNSAFIALIVGLVAMAVAAFLLARSVIKPVERLKGRMQSMADGETNTKIPGLNSHSEIGDMARTLDVFRTSLIRQKELEQAQKAHSENQAKVVASLGARLSELSGGDLTTRISDRFPEDYEQLRLDFNRTVENLNGTVTKVVESASGIRNGAAEISQSSDDLSHRTESQAATLEETAAALDELTASVKSAAEGARSVENIMEQAKQEAENSGVVVQSAVSAMTEIEQSSTHIAQIISVIDDIAFQTNLLALNAGVEAARAGEAGRGFAVVASEVRALAQRSSDAAMEIKTLIGDSSKQVERGVDLVGKAGEALQNIVERVNHISGLVTDIAEGAVEQSTGLGEINTGVVQLDQVTQQNAAMVEEATAAGHMLNSDASKLAELVAHFKIAGGGNITAMPSTPEAAPSMPTAHGDADWGFSDATPAAATDGNAALDKWQDF